jgi:hypothetical protein
MYKRHWSVHAWKNAPLKCDLIVSVLYKPTCLKDVNAILMITVDAQEQQSPSEKVIITWLRSHWNPLPLRAWCTFPAPSRFLRVALCFTRELAS